MMETAQLLAGGVLVSFGTSLIAVAHIHCRRISEENTGLIEGFKKYMKNLCFSSVVK